jgi:integrase
MGATPHPEVRIPKTKNQDPRVVPLVDQLRELFERRRERRKISREDGSTFLADLVFHRAGKPLADPRKEWDAAFKAACLPRRTWHDFRRTACRNMINAGVPEKVAMEITGHKTASIFRRYHIVAQADKAEALRKTFAFVTSEKGRSNVLPLRKPRSGKKS